MGLFDEYARTIQHYLLSAVRVVRAGEGIKKPPANAGGVGMTHGQLFFDGLGLFIARLRGLAWVIFFNILHDYLPFYGWTTTIASIV